MEFRSSQAGSNARRYPEPQRPSAPQETQVSPAQGGGGVEPPVRTTTMNMQQNSNSKSPKLMMTIMVAIAAVLLLLGAWFVWSKMSGGDTGVKSDRYQAVFLTNGQVYFGKVSGVNNDYVKLDDIYYLQVQQSVQPDDKSKTSTSDDSQVSLAKLGSELHGPEDSMHISRQQVLFWENLKNDGKVVQAIDSYKKTNK